jgi:hypothetical protein
MFYIVLTGPLLCMVWKIELHYTITIILLPYICSQGRLLDEAYEADCFIDKVGMDFFYH